MSAPLLADPAEVKACLAAVAGTRVMSDRLDILSKRFLGRPYLKLPLVGGPDTPEQLVTRIDAFDCVTFAESVLALGWSRQAREFPRRLRAIRYLGGRVAWKERNHYMTQWIRRNVRAGLMERVAADQWEWAADRPRGLGTVPGYPTQLWRPRFLQAAKVGLLAEHASTGDLLCFVSDREDLDVMHVGLLVIAGKKLSVRHAAESAGKVVEQDLTEYLKQSKSAGVLIARPLNPGGRS